MMQMPHRDMSSARDDPPCDGIVRRRGWTAVGIDASTVMCPKWVCDVCGEVFWSYFDTDNGDKSFNLSENEEDDEECGGDLNAQ